MKISHLILASAALFAAGCNKDKTATVEGGGDAPAVTFHVEIPSP